MKTTIKNVPLIAAAWLLFLASCTIPKSTSHTKDIKLPDAFYDSLPAQKTDLLPFQHFYTDTLLRAIIDTALNNNRELMITLSEIEIVRNEIRARKGEILPFVNLGATAGTEKVGRYTSQGAGDASTEITDGKEVPEVLGDYSVQANASWEIDVWKKLRNAKKSAIQRYLATQEGRAFVQTALVAEIAASYYELLAAHEMLNLLNHTLSIQQEALETVQWQKAAARSNELAVQKFMAEVEATKSKVFAIHTAITDCQNRLLLLMGKENFNFDAHRPSLLNQQLPALNAGIPAQLLENRQDIKQAEHLLAAAGLDVKVARAAFYPRIEINASYGLQAFNPSYLTKLPESLLFSLAGDLFAPLINRNAIKANFNSANARQLQALYNYQQVVLSAYLEVKTQLVKLKNLESSYQSRLQQVNHLNTAIDVSRELFRSAQADYFEVLMTQRDALDAQLELVENKNNQLNAQVLLYKQLGGGWK